MKLDRATTEIGPLLEQAKTAMETAKRAAALVEAARRELESGNLTGAHRMVTECLENSPGHEEASGLLTIVREQLDRRERERRIEETLSRAKTLAVAGSYDDALSLLDDLVSDYPDASRVKRIAESLRVRKQQDLQRKLSQETGLVKDLINARQWQEALSSLERLVTEYPSNEEFGPLTAHVRAELQAQRKAEEIDSITGEARRLRALKEFDQASTLVEQGLQKYPREGALEQSARMIAEERARHERQIAIQVAARRAGELRSAKQFPDAIAGLDTAIRLWASVELSQFRDQIAAEWKVEQRYEAISSLKRSIEFLAGQGRWQEAVQAANEALRKYPGEPPLVELLAESKNRLQQQTLARKEGEIESLIAARRFVEAIQSADAALLDHPGHAKFAALKSQSEEAQFRQMRAEATAAALDQAQRFRAIGDLDNAMAVLERLDAIYERETIVTLLLDELRLEKDERERAAAEEREARRRAEEEERRRQIERARQEHEARERADRERLARERAAREEEAREHAKKEREAQEQDARERAAREREAKERAAREVEAREHAKKEREAQEQDARERAAREREAKERAAREVEAREHAKKEREAQEQDARERAAREREAKERAAREVEARERAKKEREAQEQDARERAAREREAKERAAREAEAREHAKKEREAQEQDARERAAREREAKERAAREAEAREHAKKEREAQEQDARERAAREREAKERAAREAEAREHAKKEREAQEQDARERAAREREAKERAAREVEARERAKKEREAQEQEAREREEQIRWQRIQQILANLDAQANSGDFDGATATINTALRDFAGERALIEKKDWIEQQRVKKEREDAAKDAAQAVAQLKAQMARSAATPIAAPESSTPRPLPQSVQPTPPPRHNPLALGGAAAAAVLAAAGIYFAVHGPGRSSTALVVSVAPDGASLVVNGQSCRQSECRFDLPKGTYELEASLEGYQPVRQAVIIKDSNQPIRLELQPYLARVRVSTNLESGKVMLDGGPPGALKQGEFLAEKVPAGKHTIEVSASGGARARVQFETTPGRLPAILAPVTSSDLQVLAFTRLGSKISVIGDGKARTVSAGDRNIGRLGTTPVSVDDFPAAAHELKLEDGERTLRFPVSLEAEPAFTLFISANRDVGFLLVEAREAEADVLVNGKKQGKTGANGIFQAPLPAGEYRVTVEKPGFNQASPQKVRIARDAVRQVDFRLESKPAELSIADAVPGTQVFADGRLLGIVTGATTFSVPAGSRNIELKKDGYSGKQFAMRFEPGGRGSISGRDAQLAEIPKPTGPETGEGPVPDPRAIEARRLEQLRSSRDIAALDQFRRDFPRSSQLEAISRRIELIEWENTRGRKDVAAIQAFLSKYPRTAHRDEAEKILAQIEKERLDRANAERARLEQAEREKADVQAVLQTLNRLSAAYGSKDGNEIGRLYPSVSKQFLNNLRRDIQSLSMQLRSVGIPQIVGDTAVLQADRSTATLFKGESKPKTESDRVTITLRRSTGGWVVDSMR